VESNDYTSIVASLADAELALANTPEFIAGSGETNADGTMVAGSQESNPVYANALAVVQDWKNQLTNTPQFIQSDPVENPQYSAAVLAVQDINISISNLESELNTISDQPTSANPAYTAALAEKNSLERVIHDLREQWDAEVAAKQSIINAGPGGAPDQNQLIAISKADLAEVQDLLANARAVAEQRVTALDAEFTVTDASTSTGDSEGRAQEIRNEIENHEKYITELHNSKDQGRNAQEQMVQEIRGEIRGIEEQMEGMHNFMRELEDQQRPLHEKRMVLDKERMVLEQKQRDIEDQRGPWEEERRRYEDDLWSGFDDWQHARQQEIEERQEQMWELVRVDMDQKRDDTERGMKEMWRDFETEGRDAYKNLDRELKERHETEIEGMRRELDESRDNLQQAFEAEREEVIQEIENMRDELYEERMSPIEAKIDHLDEEIGDKFASIEGLYQQQEELAGQLEDLEAQVRKLDQKAEFGLLSVIGGAINNAEKLEQNPASMAGAPGVSLADFLPAPPSRGE
jgi:chromosome segregation ATPase